MRRGGWVVGLVMGCGLWGCGDRPGEGGSEGPGVEPPPPPVVVAEVPPPAGIPVAPELPLVVVERSEPPRPDTPEELRAYIAECEAALGPIPPTEERATEPELTIVADWRPWEGYPKLPADLAFAYESPEVPAPFEGLAPKACVPARVEVRTRQHTRGDGRLRIARRSEDSGDPSYVEGIATTICETPAGLVVGWRRESTRYGETTLVAHALLHLTADGRPAHYDGRNAGRAFVYDPAGRLLLQPGPEVGLAWAYDDAGTLRFASQERVDPFGNWVATTRVYDAGAQLIHDEETGSSRFGNVGTIWWLEREDDAPRATERSLEYNPIRLTPAPSAGLIYDEAGRVAVRWTETSATRNVYYCGTDQTAEVEHFTR